MTRARWRRLKVTVISEVKLFCPILEASPLIGFSHLKGTDRVFGVNWCVNLPRLRSGAFLVRKTNIKKVDTSRWAHLLDLFLRGK